MSGSVFAAVMRWVRFFAFFYLAILALVTVFQRRLIYFPARAGEESVIAEARAAGMEPWRNGRGELIGFVAPGGSGSSARRAVLVMHGNAGYAAHRAYMATLFPDRDVHILEYPGYGARSGRPREGSIRSAAAEALEVLQGQRESAARAGETETETETEDSRVTLVGESIGGGPVSWLAGEFPEAVSAAVLITPFSSLVDVAAGQFPILPVRWLLRDRWDNRRHLDRYPGPVAFLAAADDTVVPPRFARTLYEDYTGTARLWTVPDAGHNTIMSVLSGPSGAEIRREVMRFLGDPGPAPPESPRD